MDLNINKKLLIPALERHTLAIININADVFEKDDEQIIENYIQEIYPETFESYKNFLRKLDYQRTGLKIYLILGRDIYFFKNSIKKRMKTTLKFYLQKKMKC